jgi:hypothetical protein
MELRLTLSKLPWADGRPVQDPERRIRGELADMEVGSLNSARHVINLIVNPRFSSKLPTQ